MDDRGYVTVFLTLILSVLLMLVAAVYQLVDLSCARGRSAAALRSAMSGVRADYDRYLFEQYHVLFLNQDQNGEGQGGLEERVQCRLEDNLGEEYVVRDVILNGVVGVTDDNCAEFRRQVKDASLYLAADKGVDVLKEKAELVCAANPTELMKAVKNPVEMQNIYQTYLLDSVELCRFLFRFSEKIGKETMTEMTAAGELDALRAQIPGFIGLSFPTISAYGSNAAMAHYSATEDNCAEIRPEGFYLVDSGGQYLGGTTDVTRTIVCGPLTDRQKRDFTLVVIANLNLLNARFLHGTTGILLDACARMPLWEHAVNYDHGTGHGIGYILNVHEGPQSIRWKSVPGQADAVFEAGMIVSDEPGIYIENEYGIRTETILMTVPYTENEYGRFLRFEPLTWVPIDLRGIDPSVMQPRDIERLDAYHAGVYEKISPFFSGAELAWLRKVTLPYREYCSC